MSEKAVKRYGAHIVGGTVRRFRSILLYFVAGTLGVATMVAIAYQWLPAPAIAVTFALFFILMLPRQPRLVAAFAAGVALAVTFAFVVLMDPEWDNCADEVGGQLVEYKCSEGPPKREDGATSGHGSVMFDSPLATMRGSQLVEAKAAQWARWPSVTVGRQSSPGGRATPPYVT